MKELDKPTLDFMRHLDRKQPLLAKKGLKLFVIWIGGDEKKLNRWAKANKIVNVGLGVIATDARDLNHWRISRKSTSTTVLLRRTTPFACFINLSPKKIDAIEEKIDKHFQSSSPTNCGTGKAR